MRAAEIVRLLPGIFQRTLVPRSPLDAVLQAMDALHGPADEMLDHLDTVCDPNRTPDRFVTLLARWVDLERIFLSRDEEVPITTGLGRLRELTNAAAFLSKWRGTRPGLLRCLETATGETGFLIEEPPERPFHLRVTCPRSVAAHRALIERIVDVERPAYVTWELQFEGQAP